MMSGLALNGPPSFFSFFLFLVRLPDPPVFLFFYKSFIVAVYAMCECVCEPLMYAG